MTAGPSAALKCLHCRWQVQSKSTLVPAISYVHGNGCCKLCIILFPRGKECPTLKWLPGSRVTQQHQHVCKHASLHNHFSLPHSSHLPYAFQSLALWHLLSLPPLSPLTITTSDEDGYAEGREAHQTWSPWSWGTHEIITPFFYRQSQERKPDKDQGEKYWCCLGLGTKSACTEVQRFVTLAPWTVIEKGDIAAPFHRL